MKQIKFTIGASFIILLFLFIHFSDATSCSRIVYVGPNNTIITARSMDWAFDIMTNLWIFPAGMERNGEIADNTIKWKSKYGSVVASAYEVCSSDGMNEKGLVASVLWLDESEYPVNNSKPGLSISLWVQYVLDNFETVDEVVKEISEEKYDIVGLNVPGKDIYATLHLVVSDATGDNAIFEYVKGKLV
ncbi:MAG: linear amide C-N hydrolase, partial [Ignavibacteria bacterium]